MSSITGNQTGGGGGSSGSGSSPSATSFFTQLNKNNRSSGNNNNSSSGFSIHGRSGGGPGPAEGKSRKGGGGIGTSASPSNTSQFPTVPPYYQESASIIGPIGIGFGHPSTTSSGGGGGTIMEGTLSKWTNVMKGWQYRCFLLDENTGLLSYYTSKEKMRRGVRRGCIRLQGAVLGIDDEEDANFTITVDSKIFHLQAKDSEEREIWVRALEDAILRHARHHRPGTYYIPYQHPSLSHHYLNSGGSSGNANYFMQGATPLHHFEQRLAQADVYLQMLIQQVNNLEHSRPELIGIVSKANEFLEAIKHSIVLLQIAKNTAFPIQSSTLSPIILHYSDPEVQTGIEFGSECRESVSSTGSTASALETTKPLPSPRESYEASTKPLAASVPSPSTKPPIDADLPLSLAKLTLQQASIEFATKGSLISSPSDASSPVLFSYSSSDDEQDFYDAEEDFEFDKSHQLETGTMPLGKSNKGNKPGPNGSSTGRISIDSSQIDYDALYNEDPTDEDAAGAETHGSVISHLISQVKIGMDLTKVVLPTFILERRSLLEMYADFFAHPDMFIAIADAPTQKERMIAVLRWYLAAFHAGRRSEVAKKPYNPILGEIFQCYWNLPSGCNPKPIFNANNSSAKINSHDLKLFPWVDDDEAVVFFGEQVSHHPPISAFYAEHPSKKISVNAHIWTKSKFLGLSVGVSNIGHATVSLHNLPQREDYILGFPNGYARAILSIPWVELGGPVTISSSQTGYHATVEFKTKPFFSGDKNKIVAQAFAPEDKKKPFLTVEGEWNGCMNAKWADGRTEKFVDVRKLDIIKKNTKPIAQQEAYESRRMWKDVTAGLKFKDIEKATAAKAFLEDRQRVEAKSRTEKKEAWQPRMFLPAGDTWVFTSSLEQRLKLLQKANKSVVEVPSSDTTSSVGSII